MFNIHYPINIRFNYTFNDFYWKTQGLWGVLNSAVLICKNVTTFANPYSHVFWSD